MKRHYVELGEVDVFLGGEGSFYFDKWRAHEPNIRKSKDLKGGRRLFDDTAVAHFPILSALLCSQDKARAGSLIFLSVNHAADIPVCTRGLTCASKEEKGKRETERDRNWSNRVG